MRRRDGEFKVGSPPECDIGPTTGGLGCAEAAQSLSQYLKRTDLVVPDPPTVRAVLYVGAITKSKTVLRLYVIALRYCADRTMDAAAGTGVAPLQSGESGRLLRRR